MFGTDHRHEHCDDNIRNAETLWRSAYCVEEKCGEHVESHRARHASRSWRMGKISSFEWLGRNCPRAKSVACVTQPFTKLRPDVKTWCCGGGRQRQGKLGLRRRQKEGLATFPKLEPGVPWCFPAYVTCLPTPTKVQSRKHRTELFVLLKTKQSMLSKLEISTE
jgi:hypothetical protein